MRSPLGGDPCRWVDPVAWRCSPETAHCDVFVCFLEAAIAAIAAKLGPDALAAAALTSYKAAYQNGSAPKKDYSAGLYNGSVPDHEMDVVEDILDELQPRFDGSFVC